MTDNNSEQAESVTDVVQSQTRSQIPTLGASGEATTSSDSAGLIANKEQRQLEVGLSQIALFSKDNPVLSPLADVFESNLNNIRDKNTKESQSNVDLTQSNAARGNAREENMNKQTRVNTTHSDLARENPTRTMNYEENGAGATSSFNSMWEKKWRELEEAENARREALDKQMQDARLKLEKEMSRARVEHEIMMKRREIERQQAELQQLENLYEHDADTQRRAPGGRNDDVYYEHNYVNQPLQNTITGTSTPVQDKDSLQYLLERQQNTMDEVVRGLRMPQREYMSFYGEPRDFPLFMKNFEVNVESKESNDADRLSYLIQYCKGTARQAIEHCVIMEPEEGYKRAKDILRKNFGRNHIVTQAFLDKVIGGPPIKVNESEKLSQLARDMETCLLGSTQLGNGANINSLDTLGKVVSRLPIHLRSKWADRASQLYDNYITPNFTHLTEFVQSRAAVANTYFGQIITSKSEIRKDGGDKGKRKTPFYGGNNTTLATHGQNVEDTESRVRNLSCVLCKGTHHLERCHKFRAQTLLQRRELVKSKKVCHACLSPGHFVKDCRGARMCGVEGCQRRHHPLLHSSEVETKKEDKAPGTGSGSTPNSGTQSNGLPISGVGVTNSSSRNCRVGLQVVPVKVSAPYGNRVIETYAFLDSGSNTTMCLSSLAKDLGADCTPVEFTLSTVSGNEKRKAQQLSLDVVGVTTGKGVKLNKVWTTDSLPVAPESIPTATDVRQWSHLKDVELADLVNKEVTILIGSDVPEALCPLEVRSGKRNQPHAIRTILGWTVMGPLKGTGYQEAQMNFIQVDQALGCTEDVKGLSSIHQQLQSLYNSEFNESTADLKECLSIEDRRAKAMMDNSVRLEGAHYEIGLPWKYDEPSLPNNRTMAEKRLGYLKKRLERDPGLHSKYKATMEDYIAKGHAKIVQPNDLKTPEELSPRRPTWYLPHHPVTHPQKPEKVRIVFDCAAKFHNVSLNDQLLQGPDFTNSLVGVLMRFRQERVAVMADIEKMFHQVNVKPEDCDALKFLWWPEGDLSKQPVEYQMTVHLFGATSSPSCCSYALKKTAEDNIEFSKEVIDTVNRNFYVDDCLKSSPTKEEAIGLVKELPALLSRGGFRLTKWLSNEREVLSSVPDNERAPCVSLDLEKLPKDSALGVQWNTETDSLGFRSGNLKANTRRGILSFVASVYDPLGLVAPVVLPAKRVLQELCRQSYGWDEEIPKEVAAKWQAWQNEFQSLSTIEISRCYKPPGLKAIKSVELHHFSDASIEGYGTASYLRYEDIDGNVHCSLVMGKSRVTPLKTVTIPRLELTAATLAVKVDKQIRDELDLPINRVIFWTDSTIVLRYIRNKSKRFQTFVANRLQIIHDASSPHQWRHVPTKLNPADLASRGLSVGSKNQDQRNLKLWFHGPDFLWQDYQSWPEQPIDLSDVDDTDQEVKRTKANVGAVSTTKNAIPESLSRLIHRPSCWYRLRKSVAWLLRFRQYLLFRCGRITERELRCGPLVVKDIDLAAKEIVKITQLDASIDQQTSNDRFAKLNPVINDDIVRVGGRLEKSPLSEELKHPAILPSNHHITTLIVRYYHEREGHAGTNQTLAAIREAYWIVKGPSTVKRIIDQCVACRRRNQPPGKQIMAHLPAARVTPGEPPFSAVGVDYFGPLKVKYRRGTVKRYGCVFTCLAIRAVHIEIAHDLSTDSFIQAVCRFVSRRGAPNELFSDNGTNFRGAEVEVKQMLQNWNQAKILDRLREKGIQWHFSAPNASHTGGVWERMIRTIRKNMRALIGDRLVDDETLLTVMCEVEKMINDRPLTRQCEDPRDLSALTPNTLLLSHRNQSSSADALSSTYHPREKWKQAQRLADEFWARWIKEYLPSLQERQKWLTPKRNFAVGDIVLMVQEDSPRGQWPLAVIEETFPDSNGHVRQVVIRTANQSRYRRDIRKLCLLEKSEEKVSGAE